MFLHVDGDRSAVLGRVRLALTELPERIPGRSRHRRRRNDLHRGRSTLRPPRPRRSRRLSSPPASRRSNSSGRWIPTDIRDLLADQPGPSALGRSGARAASPARNCTMVCPTCFCSSVEEVTRPDWRPRRAPPPLGLVLQRWISAYMNGGNVRNTHPLALPPVADPQVGHVEGPVRRAAAWAAGAASPGARWGST